MEFESESDEEKLVPEERESNNEEESNESIEKEIDNNEESKDESEIENDNEWNDIDWNEANNVQQQESNWNEIDWSEKNSGEQSESIWNDINWEDQEANREIESEDENEIAQDEYSGEFGNEYASVMSTVLISENEMYAYIQKYVEAMLEKQKEQITQEEQNQPNIIEDGPSELQQFLEQEKERIRLEQEQTELEKTTSIEPEVNSISNEEEEEQELEKEVESQIDSSEEISPDNEGELNDQEEQEKLIESELDSAKNDEEVDQEEEKESITKEETNELELEQTKIEELDYEERVKHQEFEVAQEMYMNETESETVHPEEVEVEEESELTSPHKEITDAEIDDNEDSQEELEDILEHVREIEQKEEQELLEISKEQEIEQEKEEEWLKYIVNWVKEESGKEISHQLKEEVTEIGEKYGELDELTTKFLELYQKAQAEQLSQSEKVAFRSLIKALEEEDPSHIVLFTNLRAVNRYLTHQKLKKPQLNQILKHLLTRFSPKKQLSRILTANKNQIIVKILKFTPREIVELIEQLGSKYKNSKFDIQDKTYLQKKKKHTYSPNYSDGDIEFWIELLKIKHYGESWPSVFKLIQDLNNHLNQKIKIPNYYNNMIPIVKRYCKHNDLNYEELLKKYGTLRTKQPPNDEKVLQWIKIYQDREIGGAISAIRNHLETHQGYTYGETTIRRHIKKFFQKRKYVKYFGIDLTYENWMKKYKRTYFRKDIPIDPAIQSHEYILLYNAKKNQYYRVFIKDLDNPELLKHLDEFQILGISNKLQPEKVKIRQFVKRDLESLEVICSNGSVIISPDQFLFTIDDDCNIIEIKGSELKAGMPLLMPRIINIDSNKEPIDLINCGKLITKNNVQYIEQFGKKAYRFVKKNAKLGTILGQFEAEGTIPSKFQPGTVISVSTDYEYIQELQKMLKQLFGLEFQIQGIRVNKCKNCGSNTIEKGTQNICPKCNGVYNEYFNLRTKTQLAKTIFTEGLGIEHAYSYLKELPSFLYNSPEECEKGFILGYFKGDGAELDYRNKGGNFELNFETTSRRLVFGLNLLMKKLGVIMSISEHNPPATRPNSKKLYSMVIRGSSNFEKLKPIFDNLPEIDYTTSDIKTAANTHILIRKLNLELQKKYRISLRDLSNMGVVPKNAHHIATQIKRKTNLSEVLLLKTLDGLKKKNKMTPLAKKLEQVFRTNTFTKIKKIKSSKPPKEIYNISVEGLGHSSGTAFVYIKSEEEKREE